MLVQQPLLLAHAELSMTRRYLHKASVPPGSKGMNQPGSLVLAAHDGSSLIAQEPLGEGMIDVDCYNLIAIFWIFLFILLGLVLWFYFNKLPDIIFWYMIGSVGTARDLVV